MLTKRYFCAQCKKYLDDDNTLQHFSSYPTHHLEERTLDNDVYLEELLNPVFRDVGTQDGGEFIRQITTTGAGNVEMFSIQLDPNSIYGIEVMTLAACESEMSKLKFFEHEYSVYRYGTNSAQQIGSVIERVRAVSGTGINMNFGLNSGSSYVYVNGVDGEVISWKCKLRYLKMQV